MKSKKNKLLKKVIFGSSAGFIITLMIVLIPCLMLLDFFGANITDDYVENNSDYADMYKNTLNKAIDNGYGYVSLSRILYFYLEDDKLNMYDIYIDNIDKDTNKIKPISEVCEMDKYKILSNCKNIDDDQINEDVNKPFKSPIDFSKATITSFFMQERIVFGKSDIHPAWDFAAGNKTEVLSVCDGEITNVSFKYSENKTDKSGGGGNYIYQTCEVDDLIYEVRYLHLYPNSKTVKVGEKVKVGSKIAEVGTTGYSTGPHLHYQVLLNGINIDGMSLIDFSDEQIKYNPGFNNNYNELEIHH